MEWSLPIPGLQLDWEIRGLGQMLFYVSSRSPSFTVVVLFTPVCTFRVTCSENVLLREPELPDRGPVTPSNRAAGAAVGRRRRARQEGKLEALLPASRWRPVPLVLERSFSVTDSATPGTL